MPELPEVETVKIAIEEAAINNKIIEVKTSGKKMRWPIPEDIHDQLINAKICAVRRRGKYILIDIKDGGREKTIIIHLGMSGSVRICRNDNDIDPRAHDHLIIRMEGPQIGRILILNDPRRFGGVDVIPTNETETHPLLKMMGIEPLGNKMNDEYLFKKLKNKQTSIKQALLDQKIIAGIGNIYASEALYRAGISPKRLAKNVSRKKINELVPAIKNVLLSAIEQGGTSLRDHVQPNGEIGYFEQSLDVYGRAGKPCNHCGNLIKEIKQTGRTSFYCSNCQK